jgi:hypothetical protein
LLRLVEQANVLGIADVPVEELPLRGIELIESRIARLAGARLLRVQMRLRPLPVALGRDEALIEEIEARRRHRIFASDGSWVQGQPAASRIIVGSDLQALILSLFRPGFNSISLALHFRPGGIRWWPRRAPSATGRRQLPAT